MVLPSYLRTVHRLNGPAGRFEFLDAHEDVGDFAIDDNVLRFGDTHDAVGFLHRSLRDPIAMATLRRLHAASDFDVGRASDQDVLAHYARELTSGRRHVLRRPSTVALPDAIQEKPEEEPLPARPARAPREETTWVAIELVDDEGKPVPQARYILQLPDGSTREGELDFEGKARVDGVKPGTCKVSFPDYAPGEWSEA